LSARRSPERQRAELRATILLCNKQRELVAEPFRHSGREEAARFFIEGMMCHLPQRCASRSERCPLVRPRC
jgi:hypothetical protein